MEAFKPHHVGILVGVVGLAGVAACSSPTDGSDGPKAKGPKTKAKKGRSGGGGGGDEPQSALLDAATAKKFDRLVGLEKKVAKSYASGGGAKGLADDLVKLREAEKSFTKDISKFVEQLAANLEALEIAKETMVDAKALRMQRDRLKKEAGRTKDKTAGARRSQQLAEIAKKLKHREQDEEALAPSLRRLAKGRGGDGGGAAMLAALEAVLRDRAADRTLLLKASATCASLGLVRGAAEHSAEWGERPFGTAKKLAGLANVLDLIRAACVATAPAVKKKAVRRLGEAFQQVGVDSIITDHQLGLIGPAASETEAAAAHGSARSNGSSSSAAGGGEGPRTFSSMAEIPQAFPGGGGGSSVVASLDLSTVRSRGKRQAPGESRPKAPVPMENPYCSCKLTLPSV